MYSIELGFNKNLAAYPKEGQLYKRNSKNITVDYMITKSLDSSFKIIDPSLCKNSEKEVNYLVDLINNQSKVELQILDLDLRGLWIIFDKAYRQVHPNEKAKVNGINNIGDFIDACTENNLSTDETNKINVNLVNICLVVKLLKPINPNLNGLNTICIYCDLDIRQRHVHYQNSIVPALIIKRIELLELNKSLGTPKKINITLTDNFNPDPSLDFYPDLMLTTPIISFSKKDSQLRKYLNYDAWTRFIFAIRDYYNDKKSKSNKDSQIIYYLDEDKTYSNDDSIKCYLLQRKGNANIVMSKNAKYFLINRNDESNNYKINLVNLQTNSTSDLIKELESIIQELSVKNAHLQDAKSNNEETIKNLNNEVSKWNETLSAQKESFNKLTNELKEDEEAFETSKSTQQNLERELTSLSKARKQLQDSKADNQEDDSFQKQLASIDKQIELNNLEIAKIKQSFPNLETHINDLTKAISVQEQQIKKTNNELAKINASINTLNKKIKENLTQIDINQKIIKKYSDQVEFINQDEYNVFAITFRFEDEQNHAFIPLHLVNSVLNDDFKTANNFYIDEKDSGTLAILNRYADGLEQIRFGYYKNPYLFANLIDPANLRVDGSKEIDENLVSKYQLNTNQQIAVEKGINIDNFFYLQGPPGTGKTQTICAIANSYALEDKTILMTSQSHEAINNFFDRLDELNANNPLLIMIKYIADEQKNEANKYSIDYAWKRFVTKCIDACDPVNNHINHYLEVINELEANNFNLPPFMTDSEIQIVNNNRKLVKPLSSMPRFMNDLSNINDIVQRIDENIDDFPGTIKYFSRNAIRSYQDNQELIAKYDSLINDLNKQNKLPKLFNDLTEIKKYLTKDSDNHYASIFRKQYLNDDIKLKNYLKFKDYIVNNHLINIFGITTTSTITLSLLNKNDTDLFYDWPIDIVIIDEISKSTTPEILSRIVLAKKVIFAGDYKQLPPKCDFTVDECKDLVKNEKFTTKFNQTLNDKQIDKVYDPQGDEETEAKNLTKWLQELYQDSFFNKEVRTLKSQPNKKYAPYQNLTIQHRFCREIMDVVNTFYEDEEKLEMPAKPRAFPTYKLNLLNENGSTSSYYDPVILIDSSILSNEIQEYFKTNYHLKVTNDSFDTNYWLTNQYSSKVNPYDCLIVVNVIDNLHMHNPKLQLSDIGIITMTKSQKTLIRSYLKKVNPNYSKIKVDTVDNFQGREAEIIILDFVRSYGSLEGNNIDLHKRNLSFYFVNERNNVAISRSKAKLIIIGSFKGHYFNKPSISDFNTMEKEAQFLQDIYDAIEPRCILNGEDFIWLKK